MFMLLTIATLLPLLSTAITLITSGQFSSNTNWTVYNSPLTAISNTISTVPYQYVDVVDPAANLVRVRYNFSAGAFPQVRIFLMQGSVEALLDLSEFRVDGYEDLKLELTANLTSGSTPAYDSYISVSYVTPTLPVTFRVYYWKSTPTACSTTTNLSGIPYGVRNTTPTNFILQRCASSPPSLSLVFYLTELNQRAMSIGSANIRSWSNRTIVKVTTRVQGAGELVLQQKAYFIERTQSAIHLAKFGTEYAIVNQPIYTDWNNSDFVNISFPVNGSAKGIISHMLLTQSSTTKINGANWMLIGAYFGQWKTPVSSNSLPVQIFSTTVNMYANFSFTASTPSVPTGRCACFILNFRDDYNPATQTFNQPSGFYESRKVIIVFWASQIYRNQLQGNSNKFISYLGTNWKIVLISSKEYHFWAQSSLDQLTNFNIFAFVKYLRDNMTIFGAQDYLVGLQTGFRYLNGQSKITVNEYKIWKSDSNPVRPEDVIKPLKVTCQMLTKNTSVCQNTETTSDAIINFLSIPVIGVLMRFSPLISLVDEYAFYIYHRAKYDRGFRFIVSLCAEWTDGKWVPSFLERLSDWLNVVSKAVAETSIDGQTVREPNKFEEFGKSNNFYKNISIFLVISLPINLIVFGLLAIIARILEKFQILRWMRVLLRPFRCFLNLWSSILFDNITYLSFHCFLQLSKLVPYSHGTNNFPSCLFCLLTLFAILMTCFLGVPIKLFAKNLFEVDYCRQKFFKSYLLFGTAAAARFATGFFHAYVDLIEFRAFGLFLINSGVVIVVIYCRKALQLKTYFCFYIAIYLSKAILNLQLFIQVWQLQFQRQAQWLTTQNSLLLVILIFGLMLILNLISKLKALYFEFRPSITYKFKSALASHSLSREQNQLMSKNKGNKKIVPNKMSKTVQGKKKLVRKVVKKERNMTVHKISEEQIFINRRTEPNRRNKISERESNQEIRVVCIRKDGIEKGKVCFKGNLQLKLIAPKFQI